MQYLLCFTTAVGVIGSVELQVRGGTTESRQGMVVKLSLSFTRRCAAAPAYCSFLSVSAMPLTASQSLFTPICAVARRLLLLLFQTAWCCCLQAKTTKKIVLRLACQQCKAVHMHAIKVCPSALHTLGCWVVANHALW